MQTRSGKIVIFNVKMAYDGSLFWFHTQTGYEETRRTIAEKKDKKDKMEFEQDFSVV